MLPSWADMPTDRVVRVAGLRPEAISLLAKPLPANAPAIVIHYAHAFPAKADVVTAVLAELEAVVISLFPAWLPGVEGITGTGGATVPAVRALAIRLGSSTHHFGTVPGRSRGRRAARLGYGASEIRA